jgi:hypothetical protein
VCVLLRAEHPEIVQVVTLIDLNEVIGCRQVLRKLFVCQLQIYTFVSGVILPANVAVIVVLYDAREPSRFLYSRVEPTNCFKCLRTVLCIDFLLD